MVVTEDGFRDITGEASKLRLLYIEELSLHLRTRGLHLLVHILPIVL